MKIDRLDHLVLTVRDIPVTIAFYTRALGLRETAFGAGRKALSFGQQKINLLTQEQPFEPKAHHPTAGSADLCFVTSTPLEAVVERLKACGVAIEGGPVARTGASVPLPPSTCAIRT